MRGRRTVAGALMVGLLAGFLVLPVGGVGALGADDLSALGLADADELHRSNVERGLRRVSPEAVEFGSGPSPAIADGSFAIAEAVPRRDIVTSALPEKPLVAGAPVDVVNADRSAVVDVIPVSDSPVPMADVDGSGGAESSGFDEATSLEDVSRRDRNTTVFLNADGTSTVVFSSLPVHFPAGDGSWQKIDNRVVVGPDGRLTNGANEWSVTFEPMVSGGGLRFSTPDGEFGFHAAGAALVEPEVEPDGESVRYRNVFPATDLVYRLNGAGVEELLILKSRSAQPVVRFVVDGAQFDQVAGGLEGRGLYEGKLWLSNPETFTADGRPIDPGDHVFGVENVSGGDAVVELGVRSDRVDRMPLEAFPLVVDPTMEYVQNPAQTVKSYGHYVSGGGEFGYYADGYARTGNPYLSSTSTARWRSVVYVPYDSVNISNPQASIVDANVLMRYSCCSGSGTQNVFAHWADQWDFHYDKQVRRHTANAGGVPSVTSFTRTTWPGGSYAEGSLGTINNWMQPSDLRSIYHAALRQSSSGLALLLSGDEGFTYTYKKFAVDVRLTYNRWPNSPGLTKSSSGRTVTWGASAAVSDPDGDTVQYMPQIWEYTSSGWVLRKTYSWSTTDTRTYTAPASWRGTTMYLRVGVWDSTADIHGETHQRWTADTAYPWVVGNLVPSAGTLLLPANGYTVHPTPVDSPVLTFTGTVGTDPAPENDPVSYRFFVCSTAWVCRGFG